MSAWYLKKKLGELCRITIYEASDRVGGKIVTRKFDSAPAMYEAGVAEIYDYSMTGPDPLRELIQHFGLQTIPMDAEQVQLDGEMLNDVPGMRRKYGAKTAAAIVVGDALFADQPSGAWNVMVAQVLADAGQGMAHLDAEVAQAFGLADAG